MKKTFNFLHGEILDKKNTFFCEGKLNEKKKTSLQKTKCLSKIKAFLLKATIIRAQNNLSYIVKLKRIIICQFFLKTYCLEGTDEPVRQPDQEPDHEPVQDLQEPVQDLQKRQKSKLDDDMNCKRITTFYHQIIFKSNF